MGKTQRVLDPIHGLITFREESETDQLAWRLINTREFQRLRRIRQLGFSELVFPGATHTRFSHCIGVYHTARQLLEVIRRKIKQPDERRVLVASCAALLHDLGHGPFSHTFEGVESKRGAKKRHEDWTAELIRGDTEVRKILNEVDVDLADEIATLLTQREPKDIYAALVSSQFDADRLDYLQRDRYMTGAGSGGFDYQWLIDCLEVGKITIRPGDEEDFEEVDGLYLNHKGLQTAEGYLLARHHLYGQVYYHKTTRSAESMFAALLTHVAKLIDDGQSDATSLPDSHSLVKYFRSNQADIDAYFALDDCLVWAAFFEMSNASDETTAQLARALCDRKLFKCFDVGIRAKGAAGNALPRFRMKLEEVGAVPELELGKSLLTDRAKITAYGVRSLEEPGALQNVLIGRSDNADAKDDVASRSAIVGAIKEEQVFRVYVPDSNAVEQLDTLWSDIV